MRLKSKLVKMENDAITVRKKCMEESSFLWYAVAWIEVSWNSLYVVILFTKPGECVQGRGNLCRLYDRGSDSCV